MVHAAKDNWKASFRFSTRQEKGSFAVILIFALPDRRMQRYRVFFWKTIIHQISEKYLDCWSTLRANDVGWTEDTEVNKMRFAIKPRKKQVRFDRILLSGAKWCPKTIEMLGTESIAGTDDVFPSDHFGLRCTFEKQIVTP
jgi:hypothetical protein